MMREADRSYLATFGARVTALTDPLGSIERAAREIGIPATTLHRLRRGANWPTAPQIISLSKGLGVSADYLFGLTENPLPGGPRHSSPAPTRAAAGSSGCSQNTPEMAAAPFPSPHRTEAMLNHPLPDRSHFIVAITFACLVAEAALFIFFTR